MNPTAADRMPPIAKPIATRMFWMGMRTTKSTTPTTAIVRY